MTQVGRDGTGETYAGSLSTTQKQNALLPGSDGHAKPIELVRAVNAVTDPQLATSALTGTLNAHAGTTLAVPFVYHDPNGRHFVLVVPEARAYEELQLRAELLRELSTDTGPLPAYVREARAVIGPAGLRAHLESAAAGGTDGASAAREDAIVQREDKLRERAEKLLVREDELRTALTELEQSQQTLVEREGELRLREEQLESERRAIEADRHALATRERLFESRAAAASEGASDPTSETRTETQSHQDTAPSPLPDASLDDATRVARAPNAPVLLLADGDADEELEAEPFDATEDFDDSVEAILDDAPLSATLAPDGLQDALDAEEVETIDEIEPVPENALPEAWTARSQEGYAAVVDGEVRLWARGGPEDATRLSQGAGTPVLQIDPDSPLPLALLAVSGPGLPVRFARAVLDTTRPDDRAVLETLARDFRVRTEVVSPEGRALGSYAVAAPGESNAQRALSLLGARKPGDPDERRREAERLAREGVKSPEGEAFDRDFEDESALATADGVAHAVWHYEPLLDPARLERLVLARGLPMAKLDALGRQVALAALRCGVPLPAALTKRAIQLGIASDEKALAARAVTAFARTCAAGPEVIGLSRNDAARAWGPLLEWATKAGVSISDEARQTLRTLIDPDDADAPDVPDPRPVPSDGALRAMEDKDLLTWLDHPGARDGVARALLARPASAFGSQLARCLRSVSDGCAVDVAATMARAGDDYGDAWMELLGARKSRPMAHAIVAIAQTHLRRGLTPLLQRALDADEPDWKLFAWAAGAFGAGVPRAVVRTDGVDADRLAWVLAHAVRTGGGREVERVRTGGTGVLAEAATVAVGRVDEARAYDDALRKGPGHTSAEQAAHALLAQLERPATPLDGTTKTAREQDRA